MPNLKLISATDAHYSARVLKSLNDQRDLGLFCDVTIVIQDRKFRAHKVILSASSSYFHNLFAAAGQVIEVNVVRAEIFEHVLHYIYTSKLVRLRSDLLEELISAGKLLGVKFIANLWVALQQEKSLQCLLKDSHVMPVISESFSISTDQFQQNSPADDSDDVLFVSHTDAAAQDPPCEVIDLSSDGDKPLREGHGVKNPPDVSPVPTPDSTSSHTGSVPTTPGGVHQKHVSTCSDAGDQKIRLLDVSSVSSRTTPATKTVKPKTASEIDSMSSGCKVYANIGEDTFDIVPLKEDPQEGGSRDKRSYMSTPLKESEEKPVKKPKQEAEDHYEVNMDGKTFFVCAVCKRPYVCLTSLRRHFNVHSWEKKYPCRYCHKVFALAEYRTKHEVVHTGERRYQCLLCLQMFLNYQLLSSHCKTDHNQDPSGKKQKTDSSSHLYRLLPPKTARRPGSWSPEEAPDPYHGSQNTWSAYGAQDLQQGAPQQGGSDFKIPGPF